MRVRTVLLAAAGVLFLALGAIGVVLPVWPTTPFVLLAVACLGGTPRLRARVLKIPFVRSYYEAYAQGAGLSRKTVATSLVFLWAMLGLSAVLAGRLWLIPLLAAVGAGVTAHILYLRRPRGRKRR